MRVRGDSFLEERECAIQLAEQRSRERRVVEPRRRGRTRTEERPRDLERLVGADDVPASQRDDTDRGLDARILGAAASRGFFERRPRFVLPAEPLERVREIVQRRRARARLRDAFLECRHRLFPLPLPREREADVEEMVSFGGCI